MQAEGAGAAFRESLRERGRLIVAPIGWSMFPLLRPSRDTVALEAATFPLRRFDVALYERENGHMVLHRVMRVGPEGYDFCGDHLAHWERGVREGQICAVMTGFFRDQRYVDARAPLYRLYCRLWCGSMLPRRISVRLGRLRRALAGERGDGHEA